MKEENKKQLLEKFIEYFDPIMETTNLPSVMEGCMDRAFNHLYSEIEQREKQWADTMKILGVHSKTIDMVNTIKSQESIIQAIRGHLYARDTSDAVLKLIYDTLTENGYPWESED